MRDLSALRSGNTVLLHFTTPEQTTDHQALTHKGVPMVLTGTVCRVERASCLDIARLAVMPGQVADAVDRLPPALTVGLTRPVAYRVRVANPAGRDAGASRDAVTVAGAAPPPLTGLAANTVAGGVQLTWQTEADAHEPIRVEATGAVPAGKTSVPVRLLQVRPNPRDPGGAIDPTPAVGAQVTYRVYRQREIVADGLTLALRGAAATVTTVRGADVFAPAAPLGLLAVSFSTETAGSSVSLSWEPNGEPDVAGYYVYRAEATGGFVRITPLPVPGISFQDTAQSGLKPGEHVRYMVTAVDRAGNESTKSAATEADVH